MQGKRTKHGKPLGVVDDDQPDAREGQAGRPGVAERFVVPLKPGNAGGGKGPQFKTDAIRGEGHGDWATYQLQTVFSNCSWRCTRKQRREVLSERSYGAGGGGRGTFIVRQEGDLRSLWCSYSSGQDHRPPHIPLPHDQAALYGRPRPSEVDFLHRHVKTAAQKLS